MKSTLFLSVFFLFAFFSYSVAQNYKSGYIINLNGDTTRGFIRVQEWDSNPKLIFFKNKLHDSIHKLTVSDISQFTADSVVTYKRFICSISLNTIEENHLYERDTTAKVDTVFLQVLQTGKNISLLSYSDEIKTRYYIVENGKNIAEELIYRIYISSNINAIDPVRTKSETVYAQQLGALALKYGTFNEQLQKQLSTLEYHESSLTKVAAMINGLKKPNPIKKRTTFYKLTAALVLFGVISYLVLSKHHF